MKNSRINRVSLTQAVVALFLIQAAYLIGHAILVALMELHFF